VNQRLNPRQASIRIGIKHRTLLAWRYAGKGPHTYKLGGRWFYDSDDCDRWIREQRAASNAQRAAG
jgi:predicted site-specific integrase-resolvase